MDDAHAPSVAVITLHRVKNYGSVLQALATLSIVRQLGGRPVLVDYWRPDLDDSEDAYFERSRWSKWPLLRPFWKLIKGPWVRRNQAVFNGFVEKRLEISPRRYRDPRELAADPPVADYYCVGSDQVWNGEYNVGGSEPFFLTFAPDGARKFSLSSSFGHARVTDDVAKLVSSELPAFSLVTIREASGGDLVQAAGVRAVNTLDPTLLLPSEEWAALCAEIPPSTPQLLVYQLGEDPALSPVVDSVAKSIGCRVTTIDLRGRRPPRGQRLRQPEVLHWLTSIRDCRFLVTDSFHGVAFALQFCKPFAVVLPRNYSERIESLLSLVGLQDRAVHGSDVPNLEPIDWVDVHARITASRGHSLTALSTVFGN